MLHKSWPPPTGKKGPQQEGQQQRALHKATRPHAFIHRLFTHLIDVHVGLALVVDDAHVLHQMSKLRHFLFVVEQVAERGEVHQLQVVLFGESAAARKQER